MKRVLLPVLAVVFLFGACHPPGPDYPGAPGVTHSPQFSGGTASRAPDLDGWWRRLGSRELDRLVESALKQNHDLALATQRLREARALRQQAAASFLPQAGTTLSYSRLGAGGLGGGGPFGALGGGSFLGSPIEYWSAGLDASWELDVFGGRRREVAAMQARADAAQEELHGVQLALAFEVAETYFTIAGLREQLATLQAQVGLQQAQTDDTRERAAAGASSRLDLDRSLARLETTRAQIPPLEAGITGQLRRLALLTGRRPDSLDDRAVATMTLPAILPMVRTGLPGELLRRRPDLRARERELAAATAEIGVAMANFYPKFAIGAGPSSFAGRFGNLFDAASIIWQFTPRAEWSLFSGGAHHALLQAADSRQQAALLRYEKAVLSAIGEVETELANLSAETRRLSIVQRALASTADAVRRVRENHAAGATSSIDVLVEEERLRELEITEIRVKSQMLQVWVRLHKALGGGWST